MEGDTLALSQPDAARLALEALELDYGHAYILGHDDDHGWRAARRDQVGGYLAHDTPDELRAAMAEDHAMKPVRELWCGYCGRRVAAAGGRAVHAAGGGPAGAADLDGHPVEPVDREPRHWRAAREIEAEYGGAFTVTARFGILRADWAHAGPAVTAVHYEASDPWADLAAWEMRRKLDEAVAGTRRQRAGARA